MAHSRTARKNVRKNEARQERNKAAVSALRTQLKKVRAVAASGDAAAAQAQLPFTQKLLDKNAKRHRIHANKAARLKSRLAKAAHKAAQSAK